MARGGYTAEDFMNRSLLLMLLGLLAIGGFFLYMAISKTEKFGVPVKPSPYQDKRYVTPAGNTIVY